MLTGACKRGSKESSHISCRLKWGNPPPAKFIGRLPANSATRTGVKTMIKEGVQRAQPPNKKISGNTLQTFRMDPPFTLPNTLRT